MKSSSCFFVTWIHRIFCLIVNLGNENNKRWPKKLLSSENFFFVYMSLHKDLLTWRKRIKNVKQVPDVEEREKQRQQSEISQDFVPICLLKRFFQEYANWTLILNTVNSFSKFFFHSLLWLFFSSGSNFCRYCGSKASSGWGRGPPSWGSKVLCNSHSQQYRAGRLPFLDDLDTPPTEPMAPQLSTEEKFLQHYWKKITNSGRWVYIVNVLQTIWFFWGDNSHEYTWKDRFFILSRYPSTFPLLSGFTKWLVCKFSKTILWASAKVVFKPASAICKSCSHCGSGLGSTVGIWALAVAYCAFCLKYQIWFVHQRFVCFKMRTSSIFKGPCLKNAT